MGRGSGSSRLSAGSVGGSGRSGGTGSSATKAEQKLYDMAGKSVSQKAVRESLKDMPDGTIIAYKYPNGAQFVLEKVGEDAMRNPLFMQTTMRDNGTSMAYATSPVSSIQSALKSKDAKLGLTESEKKRYKKSFNAGKGDFYL